MPIAPDEFTRLMEPFAPFGSPPTVAVATSGGTDSLALALLSHQWAASLGGKAIALTVDHQLREGSGAEARQVASWLEARGMEHHTLTWVRVEGNAPPQTAIQAAARKARYHLLGQWCANHGVNHLLTAHHAQDQLETFMIRLAKGSGLKGLTSIQGVVQTHFGRLVRPLLTLDPARLKATLEDFHQPFLSDPSNGNENFTRVRWRHLLPTLAQEGLTAHTLQETLGRLNHAQRLVDQHICCLLRQHAALSPYGYATLGKGALEESAEAFEEMLKRILATIGTRAYPVRQEALRTAIGKMRSGASLTLSGCQILNKSAEWWIVREPAAVGKDIMIQQPGTYLWDNRFTVTVSQKVPCRLAALGEEGIQQGKSAPQGSNVFKGHAVPHAVLQTLPALWQGEHLLDPLPPFTFTPHYPLFPEGA